MDKEILKALESMQKELNTLAIQFHFQSAQIRALKVYAVAKIADLNRQSRGETFAKVQEMTRQIYDDWLLQIEKINPGYAARIDIREMMSPQDQEIWYLSSLPKKDEEPPSTDPA